MRDHVGQKGAVRVGFYLRKSVSFGPLRLNLSRSGVGASVGVKGARIGVGPRGTYVHAGRGGIYYRQTLIPPSQQRGAGGTSASTPPALTPPVPTVPEIATADVSGLVDADATGVLAELNRVESRKQALPFALGLTGFALLLALTQSSGPAVVFVILVLGLAGGLYARHMDVTHGTAVLQYSLDEAALAAFESFRQSFFAFAAADSVWHIPAAGATSDWKRNAGAGSLVQRVRIRPAVGKPRRVVCNIDVPTLVAGGQKLYFFPDRILVYQGSRVGAVSHRELSARSGVTSFVEDEVVPGDARVVGSTWQYVNKDGSPDRRFNNNRQLPVAQYGTLVITSQSGLNLQYQTSRVEAADHFARAIQLAAGA